MDMRIVPLKLKIVFESNPLTSKSHSSEIGTGWDDEALGEFLQQS